MSRSHLEKDRGLADDSSYGVGAGSGKDNITTMMRPMVHETG